MLSERNPLSITFPEFETYITAQQFNLSFFDVYLPVQNHHFVENFVQVRIFIQVRIINVWLRYFLIVFVCFCDHDIFWSRIFIFWSRCLLKNTCRLTTSFELTQHVFSNIFFNLVWFTRYRYKKLHFDRSQHEKPRLWLIVCFWKFVLIIFSISYSLTHRPGHARLKED